MKRKIFGVLFIMVLLLGIGLFTSLPAAADETVTYYVSTTGDDTLTSDNVTAETPWATIQHAVDTATDGDTIYVANGTYTEQILIQKSLTIIGEGATIQAPDSRAGSVTQGSYDYDYIIAAYPASGTIDVRIEGFTIDANNEAQTDGTNYLVGAFFRNVSGVDAGLFSCTIQGFKDEAYKSYGIKVDGNCVLTIDHNILSSYTRDGMEIRGSTLGNPAVTISNNQLTGSALPLQGISLIDGATGSITDNTVSGHTRSAEWAACGILVDNSNDIPVTGNTVENTFYAIFLANAESCTVSNNTLTDYIKRGISLDTASDNTISGNTITGPASGTDDTAIGLDNNCADNMIGGSSSEEGNTITMATSGEGNLYAIYMQASVGDNDNTISFNTITGGQRAVQFDGPPGITGTTTISNNIISGQEFGGICAYNNGNLAITGNTLTNTTRPIELQGSVDFPGPVDVTITGNTIDGAAFDGINLGYASGTKLISGNIIRNIPENSSAIHGQANADNLDIDNNNISSAWIGIQIDTGCTGVTITDNNIHDNDYSGISVYDDLLTVTGNSIDNCWRGIEITGILTAHQNAFTQNEYGSVIIHNDSAHDVTNNWWGDTASPAGNIVTNGNPVDYSPWWGADYVGDAHTTAWTLYTNDSIQAAIDAAAAGDTVTVAVGTYDEQVIINKSLTLEGAGEQTQIKPSTADGFQLYSRVSGGDANTAPVICATTPAASVTIKNLSVDGSSVTSLPSDADMYTGILFRGTGGIIDSVTVTGINIAEGNAIRLASLGETVNIEVANCLINDYRKNGITANDSGLTASIHHNTVTGMGTTDEIAQNGIQIGYGATGTISNNTVSDNVYSDTNVWWSSGIVVYQSDSVTVSDNTVTHNIVGILIQDSDKGTISNNTVTNTTGDQAGIFVTVKTSEFTATENSITGNTITGGWAGIWSSYCSGNSYGDNTISGCTGNGIYFWDTDSNTVSGNTVSEIHDGAGTGWGIALDGGDTSGTKGSDNNTLSGNTVNSNDTGIWIGNGSDSNNVESNTIINNLTGVEMGTYSSGTESTNTSINLNNIHDNTNYGVYNGTSVGVDATRNWWGTSDETTIQALINGQVTYDPWYDSEAKTKLVSNKPVCNTTQDTFYDSIQAAIDAAASEDTITVAAGTYHEGLYITKALTLAGESRDTTILDGTGVAAGSTSESGTYYDCGIRVIAESNVKIRHLTIQNFQITDPNAGSPSAIFFAPASYASATGMEVSDVYIKDNLARGIFLHNKTYNDNTYGITDSTFSNIILENNNNSNDLTEGYGLWLHCASNNTFTDITSKGHTGTSSGYGILVENSIGNSFTNINCSENRVGIFFYNSSTNTVSDSLIENNTRGGIALSNTSGTSIHSSTITGNPVYGIRNTTGDVDVTNNYWGTAVKTTISGMITGDNAASVTYAPYYVDSAMTILSSLSPDNVYVNSAYIDGSADSYIFGYNAFSNIQDGVGGVADGGTVNVAAGTYDENIDITRNITLQGAGSDRTVLQNTVNPATISGSPYSWKPVVIISASGTEESPLLLKDLMIKVRQDIVTGQLPGILPRPGSTISYLELNNVHIDGTLSSGTAESGLTLDDNTGLDHLVVTDCLFDNMAYGMIFFNNSNTGTTAVNIDISGTTFNRNSIKGFYAEKLSDTTFTDVIVTDNGNTTLAPNWAAVNNAGIDINLKFGDYNNIVFNNLTVTGNGVGSTNGTGLTIKARGTGTDTSYNSRPATLDTVTVNGGTFTENQNGIRFGEIDKSNTGPTVITVNKATITGNTQYGLINALSGVTVDATNNWWGTGNAAAVAAQVTGAVSYDPWHLKQPSALSAGQVATNSIVLNWTTDNVWDGDYYDFRYATASITTADDWNNAQKITKEPTPAIAAQKMTISGLNSSTTYYFGLMITDGTNSSDISQISVTTLASDNISPDAVIDLAASAGTPSTTSVVLSWTATGDDGTTGSAAKYIIKRSTSAITAANFDAATTVFNTLTPKAAGKTESLTISKLSPNTTYYFAIKVQDEIPNTSVISNVVSLQTTNLLPTVTGIAPATGDNGEARTLTFTGTNFTDIGTTVVRLASSDNVLTLTGVTVTKETKLEAVVPAGVPTGTYQARVTNSNGTSVLSTSTYIITEAAVPLPEVTNAVPNLAASNTAVADVKIFGKNFKGATAVTINGSSADIVTVSSNKITVNVPGLAAGEYDIKVTTSAGTNEASAVKFVITDPVVIDATTTEDTTTSGVIELTTTNVIPVQITLTTDNSETATQNTEVTAEIEVVIPSGTTVTDSDGNAYIGTIDSPRVVKPDTTVQTDLPEDAVVIEMGNPDQTINFDQDFVADITITAASAPSIYYYNKDTGKYSLAGKTGEQDGISYVAGGTVLVQDDNTYTIGLLLDHMSVYVASTESLIKSESTSGGGSSETSSGTTNIRGSVSSTGRFTEAITAISTDGICRLDIPAGTVGLTGDLTALSKITITGISRSLPLPAGWNIIGLTYELGPSGATFDPPVALTLQYNATDLPENVTGADLVLAYYDENSGTWVKLDSTIDAAGNTITASISHFTKFAVIGLPAPAEPASFTIRSIDISPADAVPGTEVTISTVVTNTGASEGTYTAVLLINNVTEAEKSVTIAAGSSQTVSFTVVKTEAGIYSVYLDGLLGSFNVTAVPATETAQTQETPLKLTTTTASAPATTPALTQAPAPAAAATTTQPIAKPVNWGILGGLIAAALVATGLLVTIVLRRKRRS